MNKKRFLLTILLAIFAIWSTAPAALDPGWDIFVIRNASASPYNPPVFDDSNPDDVEIQIGEGGQKVGLGTHALDGIKVRNIHELHIDRLDGLASYGPYFNIWVTDGLGHYAVIANEPSDAEWLPDRWYVPNWDFLKIKRCKVYETCGAGAGTDWVHALVGHGDPLTFDDVANLTIAPPPASYITDAVNCVGSGAPDRLSDNYAYGFNWIFGDTQNNYLNGYHVDNYYVTLLVHNVTQDTWHGDIQSAVLAANPDDVIEASAGTYFESSQIVIDKNLTINGADKNTTIIKPDHNTSASGYATTGGWIYVAPGIEFTLTGFTLDGRDLDDNQQTIQMAIQSRGELTVEDCNIQYIRSNTYDGRGIVTLAGTHNYIDNVSMNNIQRIGIHIRGSIEPTNPYTVVKNFTYVGKGAIDCLDYGIEFGGGGQGKVGNLAEPGSGCHITNCKGIATVDGSTSAGILITDYYGTYTIAEIYNSVLTDNSYGMTIGYDDPDISVVTAHHNKIYDNTDYGMQATMNASVDATNNWWGNCTGPYHPTTNPSGTCNEVTDYIDFSPWSGNGSYVDDDWAGMSNGDEIEFGRYYGINAFSTIQDGVDNVCGSTVYVLDGTYNENVAINTGLILLAVNGPAQTTIEGLGSAAITVNAEGVTIDGFTITNPGGTNAINVPGFGHLTIQNNVVSHIGDNLLSGNTHAVAVVMNTASDISDVTVINNTFDNIHAGENPALSGAAAKSNNGSASAITLGWTNAAYSIANALIKNNTITNVYACTNDWDNGGKGAYGIQIGVGASGSGQANAPVIYGNTISQLEGYWAHAIGLEGDTPGARVLNNGISYLTDHKSTSDATAVMVEDNASASSVVINYNSFKNLGVGVINTMGSGNIVNAQYNWWGDCSGPSGVGTGSGVAVGPDVDFDPWIGNVDSFFDVTFWLNPTLLAGNNGQNISLWPDASCNGHDAVMSDPVKQPVYHSNPGVEFANSHLYGASDVMEMAYSADITSDNTDELNPVAADKNLLAVFKPENLSDRQVIYKAGETTSGFNIYMDNGYLCYGMYNKKERKFVKHTTPLVAGEWYFAHLEYDAANLRFRAILNGNASEWVSFLGVTKDGETTCGVGAAAGGIRFHDFNTATPYSRHFDGIIGDVILGSFDYTNAYDYVADRYGVSASYPSEPDPEEKTTEGWIVYEDTDMNGFGSGSQLIPAYPNPFNSTTMFTLNLIEGQNVVVELYNSLGQRVELIHNGALSSGYNDFQIDGSQLQDGVYMIKVSGETFTESGRVVLVK